MILLLIILTTTTFLTTIWTVYFAFIRPPYKLRKLIKDIDEATNSKISLLQTIDSLSKDKSTLETDYTKLKVETDKLQGDWNKLSSSITVGEKQIQTINKDKSQIQSDLQSIKSEIEKLKTTIESNTQKSKQTASELATLTDQKKKLQDGFGNLQTQFQQLKKEVTDLSERKSDLEKENSHLSLEIAKKKISYGTKLVKYDDTEGDKRGIKHIGYKPNNKFSKDCFPLVSMPQPNSVIKFPRKGRLGTRGFKEPAFDEELKTYFFRQRNLQFYNDRFIFVSDNTRPYEPDFVLIDERDNLNLFIDIEIDEPYESFGRFATHFKGQDESRNQYFNDRGWIVIRFSEKQIVDNIKGCCKFIAEVIKSVNDAFIIPQELLNIPTVLEEPFWTKVQSEKWAKEKYRENYLGIENFIPPIKVVIDAGNLFQNDSEKAAEEKVNSNTGKEEKPKGKLNELNRHHRDDRIKFFPVPHIYLIDDNPRTISASTLVKRFFEDFDDEYWSERKASQKGITKQAQKDEWESNRQISADLGTQLHLDIETYFESDKKITPKNKKEFTYFVNFYDKYLKNLKPYRTEWRIFDDLIYIAGTADMIFKKDDGTYAIYDWKRSKDIKMNNGFNKGIGVCGDLDDCNYNHYCLQLNIYKKILEDHYAKPVSEMYFVQLHPNFDGYKIYQVPNMRNKVDQMFESIKN